MVTRSGEPPSGSSARSADDAPRPVRLGILVDQESELERLSSGIAANAPELDVVVSARTWMDLVTSAAFPTQLVIMDFELSEPLSIEARTRTCRAAGATVLVLSRSEDDQARERSLRAGAARHLIATQPMQEIVEIARSAMPPRSDIGSANQWRPLPVGVATPQRPRLSAGEREALRLYASGASTPEVAAHMRVQFETAKTYLRRVRQKYAKAGRPASRRSELIRRAAEDGFLE